MTVRRQFFGKLMAIVAGVAGAAGCAQDEAEETLVTANSGELAEEQFRKLLDVFVDTIVPEDVDPGALQAGLPEILLQHFERKPKIKRGARAMLIRVDQVAYRHYQSSFTRLDLVSREDVLRKTELSRNKDDEQARDTIRRLRSRIITEFYKSPTGRAMLRYEPPFPNGYPDFNRAPPSS
jgi:hypothetical protein